MEVQIQSLREAVVNAGYRLTNARQVIIDTLVSSHGHITADDLAQEVRLKAPRIGRMTIYRTLDLLCELGAIRPIYQGTGAAHFILMSGGSHHHLICNHCHQVIEFEDCVANQLETELASQFDFKVQGHLLEIHGVCSDCQS